MERTRRPAPRKPRSKVAPKDDRTKFDKWLERCREDRTPVGFHFAIPPRADKPEISSVCHIIDVDRYMLLVEFQDMEAWWVSKSIITSAATAEDNE